MDCPGEEEDHCRGAFGFCGSDGGEDAFEVVAAHSGDGIFAFKGLVEEGEGAVVFEVGVGSHCCLLVFSFFLVVVGKGGRVLGYFQTISRIVVVSFLSFTVTV